MYVLKHSATGQFLGGTSIPISITTSNPAELEYTHLTYSPGRFVITGWGGFVIGGSSQSGVTSVGTTAIPRLAGYVATFDANTGAVGWLKNPSFSSAMQQYDRAAIDGQGNVYIAGSTSDSTTFNGVTFYNKRNHNAWMPLVMKLDAATGNTVWATSAYTTVEGRASSISVAGNKVLVGGYYSGKVVFATDSISNVFTTDSNDVYVAQLDANSGVVQKISSIGGYGNLDNISRIAADRRGNFYVCGGFGTGSITIGGTTLPTIASFRTSFVAKWGKANCNCVLPAPAYTSAIVTGNTVRYTYTGTTAGIDSLVWEWGDGSRQKVTTGLVTPLTHAYAGFGKYNACVTAYNSNCGENRYCRQTALSVANYSKQSAVRIYPNPATDVLTIAGAAGSEAIFTNLLGQELFRTTIIGQIALVPIDHLPAGVFLVRIYQTNGIFNVVRIVKK